MAAQFNFWPSEVALAHTGGQNHAAVVIVTHHLEGGVFGVDRRQLKDDRILAKVQEVKSVKSVVVRASVKRR